MERRRIAARIGAAILSAFLLAAPSQAQDALALKRVISGDTVSFVVFGARPGEEVLLKFDVRDDPDGTTPGVALIRGVADGGGTAHLEGIEFPAAVGVPLYVRAFSRPTGRGEPPRSNVVPFRDFASLYLLVDDPDQRARILCYDPSLRTLETRLSQVDADADAFGVQPVLAIAGSGPFAARGGDLVRSDAESTNALHGTERLVDLVTSADQSMLLALTREEVAPGRALLRLRLIESDASAREIANLEIVRGGQLLSAWLVSDNNDSHRVLIAERQGAIREVVLGAEPGRGLTILPLSPLVREEMVDVRMLGDALVVVTRPGAGARRATNSRMVVFDLNDRVAPVEVALDAVANAFVLVERQGVPTAFVSLESGDVAVVPLDGGERPASLHLPGLRRIALGPDGALYGLQSGPNGDATAIRIDPATLASSALGISGLNGAASQFGVFGDARRIWLFAIQRRDGAAQDELVVAELDPADGHVVSVAPPLLLDGAVRRVASR